MSEFWKSTPKYWCKFCNTYVRDTKIDRAQHEATGKHQGGIQRNLREIQRQHDRDKRDEDRTKGEVARLKRLVSGKEEDVAKPAPVAAATRGLATVDERKEQMAQLAALGVAVPEEYRPEMALVGEWQTVSSVVEPGEDEYKVGEGAAKSEGVHKRKAEDSDEEEDGAIAASKARKGAWGSRLKTMTSQKDTKLDFDALLAGPKQVKPESHSQDNVKMEESGQEQSPIKREEEKPSVKEEGDDSTLSTAAHVPTTGHEAAAPTVVFKKRKPKMSKAS